MSPHRFDPGRVCIAIVGPTASGKTPLSLLIAEYLDAEIISADSRQLYKYLDVGTAKPSREERARVVHHFIDILDPAEEYNAGRFGVEAREVASSVFTQRKTPILVGGSGLYVRAFVDGLFGGPGKDPVIRQRLETRLEAEGLDALFEELKRVDAKGASAMKQVKARQVIRALEVYYATGRPMSEFHAQQETAPDFEVLQFGLLWERNELHTRIHRRVDAMMALGFVQEVEMLRERGYDRRLNALNSVGYKELFDYLEGKCTLDQAIEWIKQNTRRFAKRQLTWFRSDARIRWIRLKPGGEMKDIADRIVRRYRDRVEKRN
jgi:tRNA dimethylallyltransferase